MVALIIFNFVTNLIIVGYFVYKKNPFHFSVSRTFWCKKPYAINLMMYTYRSKSVQSSKGIFTFFIRDPKKLEKWDTMMFHSGEYKKYNLKSN